MNKLKLALTVSTICAGVAIGVSGVNAQTSDTAQSAEAVAYTPAISILDALTTAKATVEGQVQAIFLEETEEGHIYVAEISGDLTEAMLMISADTGEIVAKMTLEAASEAYFDLITWDDEDFYDDMMMEVEFDDENFGEMMMMFEQMGMMVEEDETK